MNGLSAAGRPFIVTAELPPDLFAWANALRTAHFPPERNQLSAHVTLFHAFAPSLRDELKPLLASLAAACAAPTARVTGLMNLGNGTAIALESPGMLVLRARIADHFHGALTSQDQHRPRLHITVQNKVTPEAARALQAELSSPPPAPFLRLHRPRAPPLSRRSVGGGGNVEISRQRGG